MSEVKFPGSEMWKLFKNEEQLANLLGFILQTATLMNLKRTGKQQTIKVNKIIIFVCFRLGA